MSYEQRDNSGAIFRNDAERMAGKSASFPTHSGNAMIGGREYYISAWIKEGRNGKFFSLAFNPKDAAQSKPQNAPSKPEPAAFEDDDPNDIPF